MLVLYIQTLDDSLSHNYNMILSSLSYAVVVGRNSINYYPLMVSFAVGAMLLELLTDKAETVDNYYIGVYYLLFDLVEVGQVEGDQVVDSSSSS